MSARDKREPAGTSARSVLLAVTSLFQVPGVCTSRVFVPSDGQPYPPGVLLFALDGQRVHVVGADDLATEIRHVLREGRIPGWSLNEMTGTATPLVALRPLMTPRTFRTLEREPFTTVEEVATLPDHALVDLRHIGEKSVAEIRTAIADPAIAHYSANNPSSTSPSRPAMLRDELPSTLRLRLAPFLDLLAAATLPASAETAIIAALAAEPVPPADHVVILLLETAGAQDALDYYTATHGPPASTWP
jgi:hypothetical protein